MDKREAKIAAVQFVGERLSEIDAALDSLMAEDYQKARQLINRVASNLPLAMPLINQAEGLPAHQPRTIFSAEDT